MISLLEIFYFIQAIMLSLEYIRIFSVWKYKLNIFPYVCFFFIASSQRGLCGWGENAEVIRWLLDACCCFSSHHFFVYLVAYSPFLCGPFKEIVTGVQALMALIDEHFGVYMNLFLLQETLYTLSSLFSSPLLFHWYLNSFGDSSAQLYRYS